MNLERHRDAASKSPAVFGSAARSDCASSARDLLVDREFDRSILDLGSTQVLEALLHRTVDRD